jgi:hypothetical protein
MSTHLPRTYDQEYSPNRNLNLQDWQPSWYHFREHHHSCNWRSYALVDRRCTTDVFNFYRNNTALPTDQSSTLQIMTTIFVIVWVARFPWHRSFPSYSKYLLALTVLPSYLPCDCMPIKLNLLLSDLNSHISTQGGDLSWVSRSPAATGEWCGTK